jgi:hypothetical protein
MFQEMDPLTLDDLEFDLYQDFESSNTPSAINVDTLFTPVYTTDSSWQDIIPSSTINPSISITPPNFLVFTPPTSNNADTTPVLESSSTSHMDVTSSSSLPKDNKYKQVRFLDTPTYIFETNNLQLDLQNSRKSDFMQRKMDYIRMTNILSPILTTQHRDKIWNQCKLLFVVNCFEK